MQATTTTTTSGLDIPAAATRRLVPALLLLLLLPLSTLAHTTSSPGRMLLPPWVAHTRGGSGADHGSGGSPPSHGSAGGEGGPAGVLSKEEFELVDEGDRYRGRWRSILKREVRYPDGRLVDFDVMDQVW